MKTDIDITKLLGEKASFYFDHVCEKITKDELQKIGTQIILIPRTS